MAAEEKIGKTSTFQGNRLLSVALPVVALGLGSLMGYQVGLVDSVSTQGGKTSIASRSVAYQLPELVVTLDAPPDAAVYMRLAVALELPSASNQTQIERSLPRLIDGFQTYLRSLRPEEVRGAAGTARIREELLRRANRALTPIRVQNVLLQEMIVQ